MSQSLNGKTVAILVENGFEQVELTGPKQALEEAGARTEIVSPAQGEVRGWKEQNWGDNFPVDISLNSANAESYDALLLPGGVMNPDKLRRNPKALEFIRAFFMAGKPVAAICHGPWTLIDAGVAGGRKMTSYESIQTDLKNAGAHWIDAEVVTDKGLVTSRKPDDIPAFNRKMIEEFAEGLHSYQPYQRSAAMSRGMDATDEAPDLVVGTASLTSANTLSSEVERESGERAEGESANAGRPEHIGRGDQRPTELGLPATTGADWSEREVNTTVPGAG